MEELNVPVLKQILRERGLKVSGNKTELLKRIKQSDEELDEICQGIVKSEDSVSQISRHTSFSNLSHRSDQSVISEKRAMEVAAAAALKAKENKLKTMQELEQEELKIKQRKERLRLETELAEVEAREKVLEMFEEGSLVFAAQPCNASRKFKTSTEEPERKDDLTFKQNDLIGELIACNLKGLMPKVELQRFDGDVTQYPAFIKSFDSVISSKLVNEEEKLNYLAQYTLGKPRDIVKACMHMDSKRGYHEARSLLDKRYGNPEKVSTAYIERILNWPNIRPDDVVSLDEFSIMLRGCKNATTGRAFGDSEMHNPKTMRKVLQKLPFSMQERFRRKVDEIMEHQRRTVLFEELVSFVEVEARVALNPLFGRHLFRDSSSKKDGRKRSEKEVLNKREAIGCSLTKEEQQQKCHLCDGSHLLVDCVELEKMDHKGKIELILKSRLCFACLRPGHQSKDCIQKQICRTCKGKHPTVLHHDVVPWVPKQPPEYVQDPGKTCARVNDVGSFRMSVVPIKIRAGNHNPIKTYAFLDNGSSATFCSRELASRLDPTGSLTHSTSLNIFTIHKRATLNCGSINGLYISDLEENHNIPLPPVYIVEELPVSRSDIIKQADLECYSTLRQLDIPQLNEGIGILIGINVPQALEPWEVIHASEEGEPFAIKTKLGWVVCGAPCTNNGNQLEVNSIKLKNLKLERLLINLYEKDFLEVNSAKHGVSEDDRLWLTIVEQGYVRQRSGRYEVPLPLRKNAELPNNKEYAMKRALNLRRRLDRDARYKADYCEFMTDMISRNYAEEAPLDASGYSWYIPHFGVYHPKKQKKIRVVFDCAAKYKGISLHDVLIQGPDMTSSLVDVICRFRKGRYAYIADIERMFYQVIVPEQQRNYLKFLWWKNNEFKGDPVEYRMTVHLFGACSSPSIANYALQRMVIDEGYEFDEETVQTVLKNFYVDDCLKSLHTEESLVDNAQNVRALCSRGGFLLRKFASPSKLLRRSIPVSALINDAQESSAFIEVTTLGIGRNLLDDSLKVLVPEYQAPSTKRRLLEMVASIFDPLGMISPLLLQGRIILQDLCRAKIDWDEKLQPDVFKQVADWHEKIKKASGIVMERSCSPPLFDGILTAQLHHFSDASAYAYGVVSYLRVIDQGGNVHLSFLYGRARVAPWKAITIPRLELAAATMAVKINEMLSGALDMVVDSVTFWTDSTTVLRYINNDKERFQVFVANRLSVIKDGSHPRQWKYVKTDLNPADDASRGIQSFRWLKGPEFLQKGESEWPRLPGSISLSIEGLEIKKRALCSKVNLDISPTARLLNYFSSWWALVKAVA